MNIKKIICGALSGLILSIGSSAGAFGLFWYDLNSDLPMWKKVVIFPLSNAREPDRFLISTDEDSLLYWENKYLMERFDKKIKNMHTVRLAPGIKEKNEILIDKYGALLQPFPSEKARAAAVFEQTGADMYIIPRFTQKYMHHDVSPSIEADVELKSWTEETGGPDGDKKYNEKKKTVHHVMPARDVYMNVTELAYIGYDTEANKVMLFSDIRHGGGDEKHVFRDISKYLRKEFSEIKGGSRSKKNKAGVVTIGFKTLVVPQNYNVDVFLSGGRNYPSLDAAFGGFNHYRDGSINIDKALDEINVKSIYYATKVKAIEDLKGVQVITDASSDQTPNYYVTARIIKWERYWHWTAPTITTTTNLIKSEESKWKDKNGKEHTKTTRWYEEKVAEHYGHWSVGHRMQAMFSLIDARTQQTVVETFENDFDDKIMDAYRHGLDKFYVAVNDYLEARGVK